MEHIENGYVESKSRKGNSIKIDGNWYSTFSASDLDHVNWKDTVSFDYAMKGDYRNIKGKVTREAGGAASAGDKKPGFKAPYNNVGVELGHASKLGLDVALAMSADKGTEVGSVEFYKGWVEQTETIHKLMTSLRKKYEDGIPEPEPKAEVASAPAMDKEEDIFD